MRAPFHLYLACVSFIQLAIGQEAQEPKIHPAVKALVTWAEAHKEGKVKPDQKIFNTEDFKKLKQEAGGGDPNFDLKGKLSQTILADRTNLSFRKDNKDENAGYVFSQGRPVFPLIFKNDRWRYHPAGAEKLMARGKIRSAEMDIVSFETALKQYRSLAGHYPSDQQGLTALLKRPTTPPRPRNWVQMIDAAEALSDPWKNPYQYKLIKGKPVITSHGPDGKVSDDDISSK